MWAFGCAKVLNCRFQETHSLSFVLPGTFSVCHYCQVILPIASYSVMAVTDDLAHSLANRIGPYTLLNLTLCTLADGALNTFLCRLLHRLLSFIKKNCSSFVIAQHLPMHSPHILFTSVCFCVHICPWSFSYLELSKVNVISWIPGEQSVEIGCLAHTYGVLTLSNLYLRFSANSGTS